MIIDSLILSCAIVFAACIVVTPGLIALIGGMITAMITPVVSVFGLI
jgi:hypothetical protein